MTSGPVVLIVDDSLTVRMDLAEAFGAAGFRTLPCATAREAREALSAQPVDLVLLDVLLPDADGIDLMKELREDAGSQAPVLILSSEAEVKDRVRGFRTGADEFVGKPYDRGYLVARARELLKTQIEVPAAQQATVLVIDDSATFREELRAALVASGHAVLTAETGEEGLRLAAASRPSAILVDGVLPGMDGAAVVRRIRLDAALRRTPCLLLTASEGRGAELRALDAGADAFVRKEDELGVILARLASVMRGAPAPFEVLTASLLGPKRILAVDDSVTYLEEVGAVLREDGYDVALARSGEEALELLSVQPVDCILLDVLMPGLGGQETCRRIKAAPVIRDIPLIMLTALEEREAMIDGLATGADDYISKSGEFEVLKARVAAQLRRRQFEDENRQMRSELFQREIEATEARAARELSESRAVLVAELERKNKELEAFSYSVSHDLRAPLRSIDGFSQALLQEYSESLDQRARGYLARVRSSAQRMGELIDDLLELSRVGRAELVRGSVDLSELARSVLAELRRGDPGRRVEVEIQDTPRATADARLLRVALENLIGNAWKFTARVERPRIEFQAEPASDGQLVYQVRDNGAGFKMEYASKLFQPFQRLHSESEFSGTGIGLATVHRIVDRHGGRVWTHSAPNEGAVFSFTLPPPGTGGRA
ncbi:MAG: response regulator [Vicinamibacteria bacterium]